MTKRLLPVLTVTALLASALAQPAFAAPKGSQQRTVVVELPNTTQGPPWPPSEVMDADGNFIVVGFLLTEVAPGVVAPISGAAIVSKDTVPPLRPDGTEDVSNWFGAPYQILRHLDLRPGSPDLDLMLHSNSFGPAEGDFGGTPRIPREGESAYNLNGIFTVCPELFPTGAQGELYGRPSLPLHQVPIWGFQGDQVAYDAVTGEPYDPATRTGAGCPATGCPGEDTLNQRRTTPITLGEWLRARGDVRISLQSFDQQAGGHTQASFDFRFRSMIPNAVYTVWAVRAQTGPLPGQLQRRVAPLGIPNVFITDAKGNATASFVARNPFPDPATDTRGLRITGFNIVFHSDYQNWGTCFGRFGPGTDVQAQLSSFALADFDVTDFVTVAPSN